MKRTLLILLLALAVRPAQAADENERVAGEAGAKLYAIVQSVLSDATATSVLVIRDGVVLLEKAWGLADRKSGAPATLRTTYDVGSLAKQFTAAAILRLEQDGRLSLDDPVRKHFPDLPEERGGVTISHLLHHTSGIARKSPSPLGSAGTPQEVATRILGPDPETPPGERFSYSNHGYCLLAALVQKVSGVPFEKYLKEAVFGPAGMTSTGFCQDPEMDGARCAKRYGGDGGKLEIGSASYYAWGWGFRGCTGVVTDIRDLERWLAALDGIEVLSAASKEKLFQQGKGGYALGWFVATGDSGAVSHSHGGASQGFSAHLARYPETKSAIVVLCARQDLAPKLAGELERALFPSQPPPPDAEVDPEVLQALTGTYEFPRGGASRSPCSTARSAWPASARSPSPACTTVTASKRRG